VTDRERELLAELAAAFPGAGMFWRNADGEIVMRALDEAGIEDALRTPAPPDDCASSSAPEAAQPAADHEQLGLFDDTGDWR
jgi:hypothetical protein